MDSVRGFLSRASCLPESFRRALVADAREDSPVSDALLSAPGKRDGISFRRASPPMKCNTTPRPARHGAPMACGRTGFVQEPVSGRLEMNVADVMLAQHGVERRQVFPHKLLKVLRRLLAPLPQLILHCGLLRRGRKIRASIELAE